MQEAAIVTSSHHFVHSKCGAIGNLVDELMIHVPAILNILIRYHYTTRGHVSQVVIEQESVLYSTETTGSFSVRYNLNYTISCSDVNYDTQDKMVFQFEIDPDQGTIILTGENIPEREPDEL